MEEFVIVDEGVEKHEQVIAEETEIEDDKDIAVVPFLQTPPHPPVKQSHCHIDQEEEEQGIVDRPSYEDNP